MSLSAGHYARVLHVGDKLQQEAMDFVDWPLRERQNGLWRRPWMSGNISYGFVALSSTVEFS